jgi:hypothetical protein
LVERLKSLESQRKTIRNRIIIAVLIIILPFAALLAVPNGSSGSIANISMFGAVAFVIGGIAIIILTRKKIRDYRAEYKSKVVAEIVKMVDESWDYQADGRIGENEYRKSDLFRDRVDRFKGDDLITGTIDKTDFRCSEIHSEYKTWEKDDDGKTKEEWHTIFKGLFFHADFNKNFSARTYVVPEARGGSKVFSTIGGMAQRGDRVKLEDPEFEKIYEVYSTDQIESRYILTPAIMQAMTAIKRELNTSVYFSFIDERVYCAMYFNKDLFEPRIMKSGVNFEDIEKMYNLFATNALIINELNLNTRIWTKE